MFDDIHEWIANKLRKDSFLKNSLKIIKVHKIQVFKINDDSWKNRQT